MVLEILRYVIVFFVVGWGAGLISALSLFLLNPLWSSIRGTDLGRVIVASTNGAATFIAVYLAYYLVGLTGSPAKYAMYAIAFTALMSNDLWRIRTTYARLKPFGHQLDQAGVVVTEKLNLAADVIGFAVGIAILPRMAAF